MIQYTKCVMLRNAISLCSIKRKWLLCFSVNSNGRLVLEPFVYNFYVFTVFKYDHVRYLINHKACVTSLDLNGV